MKFEYKSSNFLSTPMVGDRLLKISNKSNVLKYGITPDISHFYLKNNCIIVKVTNKNDIKLDFENNEESYISLRKLNEAKSRIISWLNGDLNPCNIDNNGCSSTLVGLTDTSIIDPTEGDVLVYLNGIWVNELPGYGNLTLEGLSDTTISNVSDGDILVYSGGTWINYINNINDILLDDITDVTITNAMEGDILLLSGGTWINTLPDYGNLTLDGLSDTLLSNVSDGDILVYSGGTWINYINNILLDDIVDVVITNVSEGDELVYIDGVWVNSENSKILNDIVDVNIYGVTDGDILVYSGGTWVNHIKKISLDDIVDVNISGSSDGDILVLSGGSWTNKEIDTIYEQYINTDKTTQTVGGIFKGTRFNPPGSSMHDMWTELLYPYLYPKFINFYFNSEIFNNEIGYNFIDAIAVWGIVNDENLLTDSIRINGHNIDIENISTEETHIQLNFNTPMVRTSDDGPGELVWNIQAFDTKNNLFPTETIDDPPVEFIMRWDWLFYWGTSEMEILDMVNLTGLTGESLYSSFDKEYEIGNGGYKYICFSDYYGGPINFVDKLTGFSVAMYGGYPNTENGYSYDLISVVNKWGEWSDYRVYRSTHKITDNLTISVK